MGKEPTPSTKQHLTSPPLTIETNIDGFNFNDPTLDSEAKKKLYDDAEEVLENLIEEYYKINESLRKMEKELMCKKEKKIKK